MARITFAGVLANRVIRTVVLRLIQTLVGRFDALSTGKSVELLRHIRVATIALAGVLLFGVDADGVRIAVDFVVVRIGAFVHRRLADPSRLILRIGRDVRVIVQTLARVAVGQVDAAGARVAVVQARLAALVLAHAATVGRSGDAGRTAALVRTIGEHAYFALILIAAHRVVDIALWSFVSLLCSSLRGGVNVAADE